MSDVNTKLKVLFLGKKNDKYTEIASNICMEKFKFSKIFFASRNDKIDKSISDWKGDIIISYLFPKLIKKKLLFNTKIMPINFHPGPPKYPGIGCTNYAIYNNEKQYGVTCHLMNNKFDAGEILKVTRFKVNKKETLYSLTQRSYLYLFEMYLNIIEQLRNNKFPEINKSEKWNGRAKTRKQFEKFLSLKANMKKEEISKRIFATTWPGKSAAYITLKGARFEGKLDSDDK